jgi:ferritin
MSVSEILDSKGIKMPMSSDKMSQGCIDLLNFRINEEEKSWRLYEDMYLWLEDNGYVNAAILWREYAMEELTHADWAKKYLLGLGVKPELLPMPAVNGNYSFPSIIKDSYDHEMTITKQCQELAKYALGKGDFMLLELAQQYLKEQHEELSRQQNWVDQLEAFGSDNIALRLLDAAMKK